MRSSANTGNTAGKVATPAVRPEARVQPAQRPPDREPFVDVAAAGSTQRPRGPRPAASSSRRTCIRRSPGSRPRWVTITRTAAPSMSRSTSMRGARLAPIDGQIDVAHVEHRPAGQQRVAVVAVVAHASSGRRPRAGPARREVLHLHRRRWSRPARASTSCRPMTSASISRSTAATRAGSRRPSTPTHSWMLYEATRSRVVGAPSHRAGAGCGAAATTATRRARPPRRQHDEVRGVRVADGGAQPVGEARSAPARRAGARSRCRSCSRERGSPARRP